MKAKNHEAITGLSILVQCLIVQLMEVGTITIEQGERIFDAAEKVARKSSPGAAEVVAHVRDALQWDE